MNFKDKYIKYKFKYLQLKYQCGGFPHTDKPYRAKKYRTNITHSDLAKFNSYIKLLHDINIKKRLCDKNSIITDSFLRNKYKEQQSIKKNDCDAFDSSYQQTHNTNIENISKLCKHLIIYSNDKEFNQIGMIDTVTYDKDIVKVNIKDIEINISDIEFHGI